MVGAEVFAPRPALRSVREIRSLRRSAMGLAVSVMATAERISPMKGETSSPAITMARAVPAAMRSSAPTQGGRMPSTRPGTPERTRSDIAMTYAAAATV